MSWSISKFYKKLLILTKFFRNFVYVSSNKTKKNWKKKLLLKLKKNTPLNIFSFIWYLEHRLDCFISKLFL